MGVNVISALYKHGVKENVNTLLLKLFQLESIPAMLTKHKLKLKFPTGLSTLY